MWKEKGVDPITHELVCIGAWAVVLDCAVRFGAHSIFSSLSAACILVWLFSKQERFDLINLTHGWLTDWGKEGGWFKEWVRDMSLSSINHGWLYAIRMQPVYAFRSTCHALSWMPFMYQDRDWDHAYLLRLMHEKLKRMRLYQEKHGNSVNHMEIAHSIKVAETLLDRLIKDDYCAAEMLTHWEKFEVDKRWNSGTKTDDGCTIIPAPSEEEWKDSKRIYDKEEALRKQDLEFFGKWFARHIRSWWD